MTKNANTFHPKRQGICPETPLRFTSNVLAFGLKCTCVCNETQGRFLCAGFILHDNRSDDCSIGTYGFR